MLFGWRPVDDHEHVHGGVAVAVVVAADVDDPAAVADGSEMGAAFAIVVVPVAIYQFYL